MFHIYKLIDGAGEQLTITCKMHFSNSMHIASRSLCTVYLMVIASAAGKFNYQQSLFLYIVHVVDILHLACILGMSLECLFFWINSNYNQINAWRSNDLKKKRRL